MCGMNFRLLRPHTPVYFSNFTMTFMLSASALALLIITFNAIAEGIASDASAASAHELYFEDGLYVDGMIHDDIEYLPDTLSHLLV